VTDWVEAAIRRMLPPTGSPAALPPKPAARRYVEWAPAHRYPPFALWLMGPGNLCRR
jgi:hypothetical protein